MWRSTSACLGKENILFISVYEEEKGTINSMHFNKLKNMTLKIEPNPLPSTTLLKHAKPAW